VLDDHTLEDDEDITQEDSWTLISKYFEEKGLVRQQLDSFDEFLMNSIQEVVDETLPIDIFREPEQSVDGHENEVVFMPLCSSSARICCDLRHGMVCSQTGQEVLLQIRTGAFKSATDKRNRRLGRDNLSERSPHAQSDVLLACLLRRQHYHLHCQQGNRRGNARCPAKHGSRLHWQGIMSSSFVRSV